MSLAWIEDELSRLAQHHLRRQPTIRGGLHGARVVLDGRPLVNFGANDYLGLAGDPRLAEAAALAARRFGWGGGASPLVSGRSAVHAELERHLAAFEGCEAALVFPSGYAANTGVIPALAGDDDLILSDARNHASIIDGCRLARAQTLVYRHNDPEDLIRLLQQHRAVRRRLIVSDTVFSMDGDVAPLQELAEIAARWDAMLVLDEAHATGVMGAHGRGAAEVAGIESPHLVRIGTLSKALGGSGGFVTGSRSLIDWLFQRARSYVFSTAGPPAAAAAALAALSIVRDEPQRRRELMARALQLRVALTEQGWNTGTSSSQIIPLVVGEPDAAVRLSAALRAEGLFVPAIRPPSVPPGQSLLRISLSYVHEPPLTERLLQVLSRHAPRVTSA